jgi:hypothetical protein
MDAGIKQGKRCISRIKISYLRSKTIARLIAV